MAGRPKRRERAAGGLSYATHERARTSQARAIELAEAVDKTSKLARVRLMRGLMGSGEWLPGYTAKALSDAWGMPLRTVENDASIAWLMVQLDAGEEMGTYAVAGIAASLERDSELADKLTDRLDSEADVLEPKPLRDLAESWKAVAGERNRMAELLARASGKLSGSGGVQVNVDARVLNVTHLADDARAYVERAQAGDERADRVARLLLASGCTTLDELRAWLAEPVAELVGGEWT